MSSTETETQVLQNELIQSIREVYDEFDDLSEVELNREGHLNYLLNGFNNGFPSAYTSLDTSRPWLVYWTLHSLDLLGYELNEEETDRAIETLAKFQSEEEGGFCGGDHSSTGQLAHLAPTYASILSLAILAQPRGYNLINRSTLRSFLKRLKTAEGSFRMHAIDGEIDVRAAYCAVVVGKLTGCWDEELEDGLVDWIAKCQTWEGGFGGVPGAEAHGGYTFCAIAALSLLLNDPITALNSKINTASLIYWLTAQQVQEIGGFRGRTNKLTDGCYSFWLTAGFECLGLGNLVDSLALQRFILLACQDPRGKGLRDKPGKSPDFYHTCYCLSGLALAQHQIPDSEFIMGGPTSLLRSVDAKFNVVRGKAEAMQQFFNKHL